MAKITDFTTPFGTHGNLFDIKSIWGLVLGAGVLLVTFGFGQRLAGIVHNRIPAVPSTPQAPFQPRVVQQVVSKEVI